MMRGSTVKSFYETFDLEKALAESPARFRRFLDAESEFLRRFIPPQRSVLEIGCGFGRLLREISPKARVAAGIDFSSALLSSAKQKLSCFSNISLLQMDANRLRFGDCSFRFTICFENTFGNMPGSELQVLKEMKRVTKKGGRIILSVFSEKAKSMQIENYTAAGLKDITDRGNSFETAEGLYSRRFTKSDLEELFRSIGLECEISSLCPENYMAIAER